MQIRVLTLWEPYATLIFKKMPGSSQACKQIETRTWKTAHRGMLGIHAAKRWGPEQRRFAQHPIVAEALQGQTEFPLGCLLGLVTLSGIGEIVDADKILFDGAVFIVKEPELSLGEFSTSRYAWFLDNPVRFDKPFPVPGFQRLWTLELQDMEAFNASTN